MGNELSTSYPQSYPQHTKTCKIYHFHPIKIHTHIKQIHTQAESYPHIHKLSTELSTYANCTNKYPLLLYTMHTGGGQSVCILHKCIIMQGLYIGMNNMQDLCINPRPPVKVSERAGDPIFTPYLVSKFPVFPHTMRYSPVKHL